jgi:hypothetical protein
MEYNYVCSFGTLCHSGIVMQRINIKLTSYPFDWIFSNHKNILHCIETKFHFFLDKSYYKNISDTECGHTFYDKGLCNPMWRHHNPLTNDNNYQYIQRCVSRFNQLLKFKEQKLFIMTYVNQSKLDDYLLLELLDFNNKLSNFTCNYTLLIIFHIPNQENNHYKFKHIGNIHILHLYTKGLSAGNGFFNEDENIFLDNIIKNKYKFNLIPVK